MSSRQKYGSRVKEVRVECKSSRHKGNTLWSVWITCCCVSHSVVSDSLWPIDHSPPGSSVHGILQAGILEWVVISFSRGSSWLRDQTHISWRQMNPTWEILLNKSVGAFFAKLCMTLETPWTVACQVPLSMGFSRQEYWSGLPFPSP